METQQAVDLVPGALSELQRQSQENMTISDNEAISASDAFDALEAAQKAADKERAIEDKKKNDRDKGARCLGGYRAADDFRAENFTPSDVTRDAFAAAQSFDASQTNLYLCGPTGSGKSHLAAIAARRSFQRPGSDWYNRVATFTPMQISRAIRSCTGAIEESQFINQMYAVEVLVIEDLGVQKDTDFLVSVMYEAINDRYQSSIGGLIVTSNLTLGDLARKMGDDRIPSRLAQMCKIFNLNGESDHRVKSRTS